MNNGVFWANADVDTPVEDPESAPEELKFHELGVDPPPPAEEFTSVKIEFQ